MASPSTSASAGKRQTTTPVETAFLRWFRSSGGTLDERCRIQPIPGMGRGMLALSDIPANTTIFTIPRHLLLNLSTSALPATIAERATEVARARWNEIEKMGWVPLILAMLWERRRADLWARRGPVDADISMEDLAAADDEGVNDPDHPYATAPRPHGEQLWGPYFTIMPKSFSTPMFWDESDLKHLEGTSIVDKIARSEVEQDYHKHVLPFVRSCPEVFGTTSEEEVQKWYGLESYHVMGSRILSRSFHVKSRKKGRDGEAVDMDAGGDDDGEDLDEEGEGEVLDEEEEGVEEVDHDNDGDDGQGEDDGKIAEAAAAAARDGDETRDTHDGEGDALVSSDDDDSDDDEEDESEQVTDISMTPMADMLNARFSSDNARLFYKSHVLCMRTTKPIAAGSQIFNTYADPPNSDLLRRYGHVDEPNGNDSVELPSELVVEAATRLQVTRIKGSDQEAVRKDLKERLAWACSSLGIDEVFVLGYLFPPAVQPPHRPDPERPTPKQLKAAATGGGIEEELIALARILGMSRPAFEKARDKGKGPSARIEAVEVHPPSASNKKETHIETAQIVVDALLLRLAQLPGGADFKAEEALLYPPASGKDQRLLSENERRALVVRLGEKRVLLDQKRVVEYVLDRLKADAKEREKEKEKAAKRKGSSDKDRGGKKARR